MEPRYPSSSVNLSQSSRSSIRHRSGAYSPQLDHNDGEGPIQKPSVMPNMAERRHLSQQLEKILPYDPVRGRGKGSVLSDLDQVVAEPTVMLVQSRTVSDLPISSPDLPLTIDRFPQRSWTRTPITRTRTTPLEPSSFIISHHRNEYHDAEAILPFPPMSLTQHTPDDLGPAILASTTPFQKDENPENLDLPDKAPNYSRFDDENERSSDFPRTLPLRRSHLLSRTSPPMSKPATSPKKQTVTQKKKRYTVKSQPLRSSPSSSPTLPDTRMSTSTTLSKTETLKSQGSGRSTLPSYASISLSKAVSGSVSTRPSLLRSLDTTEKLTHKFPIHHRSVRNVQTLPMNCGESHRDSHGKHSHALASTILNELEERGLGMERVNRWNTYKWSLFLSVCSVFAYGLAGLVYSGLTWFRAWDHADVMYVADYDILVLITIASAILLLTFLVGFTGTILNSRPILALYALLLWPALISILAVGYPSYKRYAFSLDRKLNLAWSQCALHSFTPSKRCFSRTQLPGCKAKLYNFEHTNLYNIWSMAFSLVPLHILNIFVSLLCANHVTKTFGKGITPKQYRLSGADVKADAEKIFGAIKDASRVVHPPPAISRPPLYGIFREDRKGSRTSLLGDHSGVAFEEVDDGRDAGEAVPLSTSNVLSSRSSSTGFLSYNPWNS